MFPAFRYGFACDGVPTCAGYADDECNSKC